MSKKNKKVKPEDHERVNRDVANDDPNTQGIGTDAKRDHSERAWGGDQDIDTAGMIPGNKATDRDEPTGF